jgi:UDP:flavonoid glycosyltransferase YjiC (YdhE family)
MIDPPTIVFQPFATSWLGHTSRLIAIAQAVRRECPAARLPFLVEGNCGPFLEQAGFPHFALPKRTEFAGVEWEGWNPEERDRMLTAVGKWILDQLRPQIVVFDSPPCPFLVDAVRQRQVRTVFTARKTRTAERTIEWAIQTFPQVDLIIIPHEVGEVPIPPELASRTHFVGPIVRASPNLDSSDSPKTAGPMVLITGGGGGFPGTVEVYNLALSAVELARSKVPELRGILVTGPMFKEWERLKPVAGVTILPFDADLGMKMQQADVVICQAGYNTMQELSLLSAPVISIPAMRVADNQFERANQFAQRRANFAVFTETSAEALKVEILHSLAQAGGVENRRSPPPSGAERAARLILSLLT